MKNSKESYFRVLKNQKNQRILNEYLVKIETMGRAKKTALAIFNILRAHPKATIPELVKLTGKSKQTVWAIIQKLVVKGIVCPMTEKKRYQTYCLSKIEGTPTELFACDISMQNKAGVYLNFTGRIEAIAEADKPTVKNKKNNFFTLLSFVL